MRCGTKFALMWDMFRARLSFRRRGSAKRLLVIRLDGFGDFALYLPEALALRERYPSSEYHLAFCANAAWCAIAEKLLPFDDFIPLSPQRYVADMAYRRTMNRRIAEGNYGQVLQPRFFREPLVEDRIALAAGAGRGTAFKVGETHLHAALGRRLEKTLYDNVVACGAAWHESRRNRAFSAALGVTGAVSRPELPPPLADWPRHTYIVVLPGSGKGARAAWPPERWGEALAGVDMPCAVAGTAEEEPLVTPAARGIGARAVPLAGRLSAWDLARLLANARAVVGNDTGGIHFAAHFGVPALAVTGGGHHGCYYPYPEMFTPEYVRAPRFANVELPCYGCRWQCTRASAGVFPCMSAVTVSAVAEAVKGLLADQDFIPRNLSAK